MDEKKTTTRPPHPPKLTLGPLKKKKAEFKGKPKPRVVQPKKPSEKKKK